MKVTFREARGREPVEVDSQRSARSAIVASSPGNDMVPRVEHFMIDLSNLAPRDIGAMLFPRNRGRVPDPIDPDLRGIEVELLVKHLILG